MKPPQSKKKLSHYQALNATIQNVEDALDRKLKVEKAMIQICLRYTNVNLKNVVHALLEGDYPIVDGFELHDRLARPLGIALEEYDDGNARKEDVMDLIKKWSLRRRKKALKQKPVRIPVDG